MTASNPLAVSAQPSNPPAVNMPAASSLPASPHSSPPIQNLRITLWGVQGSCPIFPTGEDLHAFAQHVASYAVSHSSPSDPAHPGHPIIDIPDLPNYGGETSCIEVETAEGNILVLDLGSGVRSFSRALLTKWKQRTDRTLYVFGTHPHLDHRQGLSFASFCFARPPFVVPVFGSHLFLEALDDRYGLFSRKLTPAMHLDDPLDFRLMSARFTPTELRPAGSKGGSLPWPVQDAATPVHIGSTTVTAFPTYHGPTPCLAYKIHHGTATFVYCTDHELRHGPDPTDPRQIASETAEAEIRRQCMGVNAAYFDGQYLTGEYEGKQAIGLNPPVPRMDWGHGCLEDVLNRATECRIGRTYAGHHDPERPYMERFHLDQDMRRWSLSSGIHVELAKAGAVIDL
jgi:hypothetical protein